MADGNGTSLAKAESASLGVSGGLSINGFAEMERAAKMLAQANGIVPRAYQGNPAAVAAIIMTGFELGIAPMTAMRELHLIEGKVSLSATLMLTLARRAGIRTRWLVTDTTKATIGVIVPGQAEQTLTFSADDAKAAGLWGKGNWLKHPAAMLRARATSAAVRAFCPEAIGGSVYESDSGELTDGVPAVQYIDATIEPAKVEPSAKSATVKTARPRLADCADAAALRAWCESWGAAAMKAGRGDAIMDRAAELEIPLAHVRVWLGLEEAASPPDEQGFDLSEQDAPPPDDR